MNCSWAYHVENISFRPASLGSFLFGVSVNFENQKKKNSPVSVPDPALALGGDFIKRSFVLLSGSGGREGAAPGQDASLIFPASFSSVALGFGSSLRASDSRFKSLAVNQRMFLPGNGVIIIIPRGRGGIDLLALPWEAFATFLKA
ncbi:Hypothetical protein NTJ_07947 [Nesidiocoris tenuis]|uniref:Uncharacterized protein n=1 Tax=Nesidiocoris tenuis TaxID=355587 RepID=A0ABN7AT55_9HEMI|nr:Hypothetical protein NTJ_07947 [Nesidiocoris tenuis]